MEASLKLVSDGTPEGTKIVVEPGGMELPRTAFRLESDPQAPGVLQLLTVTVRVVGPAPDVPRLRQAWELTDEEVREMRLRPHSGRPPEGY